MLSLSQFVKRFRRGRRAHLHSRRVDVLETRCLPTNVTVTISGISISDVSNTTGNDITVDWDDETAELVIRSEVELTSEVGEFINPQELRISSDLLPTGPFPFLEINCGTSDDFVEVRRSVPFGATIYGGFGNDRIRCFAEAPNLSNALDGGEGNDTLIGGNGSDYLIGRGGNDRLDGGGGRQDHVTEFGDVHFTLSTTQLRGVGTDTLSGIEFANLSGGSKANRIDASRFPGTVYLNGQGGDDTLIGSLNTESPNYLDGGDGNDRLISSRDSFGTTHFRGGAGDDDFRGQGIDDIVLEYTIGGQIRLSDRQMLGVGTDRFQGMEGALFFRDFFFSDEQPQPIRLDAKAWTGRLNFQGSDADETLFAGSGPTAFYGNGGNDLFRGGENSDTVDGGGGDDDLDGGAGPDLIFGGAGEDRLRGGVGRDTLNGGEGNDTSEGGAGDDYLYEYTGTLGRNILRGGDGHDVIIGDEGDDRLDGGKGNDALYSYGGQDTIRGEDGHDVLVGGTGDDLLTGGVGSDTIFGEAGNDTLLGGINDDTAYGGLGDDLLDGELGNDILNGEVGNDTLVGGEGNDALLGFEGHNSLVGGPGNDTLVGGLDDDTLLGGRGNDLLLGEEGNDSLRGGGDRDTLVGGSGNNALVGDPQEINEAFVFDLNDLLKRL